MDNGILLDENLSEAFKLMAINEKLCKIRDHPLLDSYVKGSQYLIDEYKFDILSSLIIFGKIYSNSYSSINGNSEGYSILNQPINFSTLHDEGVFQFVKIHKDDLTKAKLNTTVNDFRSIKDLVLESSAYHLNRYDPLFKFKEKDLFEGFDVIANAIQEQREDLDDFFITNLKEFDGIQSPYYDLMLANPQMHPLIDAIIHSYRNIATTLKSSSKMGIFSKTAVPNLDFMNKSGLNNADDYIQVYKVILEEDVTFPFPQTLKEAIALSKDKRASQFREILEYWVNALKENRFDDLVLLRNEIARAKVDLKKINNLKKIGRIVSYISLPISIVSLILHMPIGIILSPIGPAINLKSFISEIKYKWLLFGKWK